VDGAGAVVGAVVVVDAVVVGGGGAGVVDGADVDGADVDGAEEPVTRGVVGGLPAPLPPHAASTAATAIHDPVRQKRI
jgi:hypothetical protein